MSKRKRPEEEKDNRISLKERFKRKPKAEAGTEKGEVSFEAGQDEKTEKRRFSFLRKAAAKKGADKTGESTEAGNDFGAMIRSADPVLRLADEGTKGRWKKDILLNLSFAALLMSVFALFCMSFYEPLFIAFAAPAAVVFMLLATLESVKPGKLKWIAAAVIAVILIVIFAVWHTKIIGGLAFLMNEFYEYCEDAQAYIYPRFARGDNASAGAARLGIAWLSAVAGLVTALPPKGARRTIAAVICIAVMTAFAYYGLLPSWACIIIMAVALLIATSGGRLVAIMPVVLTVLLVFGAMYFIDPGEIYGVSRADENMRDRLALRTAQLEGMFGDEFSDPAMQQDEQQWDNPEEQTDPDTEEHKGKYGKFVIIGIAVLILVLIAAAGFLIYRRIARKRKKIREGLDSRDPRIAVVAMFPYTVRWLIGGGVEAKNTAFTSLVPSIRENYSDNYAERYQDMYRLWSEAAYSDHDVSAKTLRDMDIFMQDTIKMVEKKASFTDKLRIRLKYAL